MRALPSHKATQLYIRTPPVLNFYPYIIHIGGRVYPVRHYPVAIRLRDREGHAILCIALNPRSGDSLGAILGVRSVALLHPRKYGRIMQPICKNFALKSKLLCKILANVHFL